MKCNNKGAAYIYFWWLCTLENDEKKYNDSLGYMEFPFERGLWKTTKAENITG